MVVQNSLLMAVLPFFATETRQTIQMLNFGWAKGCIAITTSNAREPFLLMQPNHPVGKGKEQTIVVEDSCCDHICFVGETASESHRVVAGVMYRTSFIHHLTPSFICSKKRRLEPIKRKKRTCIWIKTRNDIFSVSTKRNKNDL